MAKYFTGTSTGNRYEVGKDYKTGDGRVMTANEDGSFTKKGNYVGTTDAGKVVTDNSGRGSVSRGSYGNPNVEWYASGADAVSYTSGDRRTSATAQSLGGGTINTDSGLAVRVPSPTQERQNRGAFIADLPGWNAGRDITQWSGKDDPAQDNLIGGWHLRASPRWSNAELFEARYGEVGETLIGLAVLGADIGYNARIAWDKNGPETVRSLSRNVNNALQPDSVGDAINGAHQWLTTWADENKARENERAANVADVMDVFDYKQELQKAEWDRIHTVVNPGAQDWTQDRLPPNVWGY